MMPTLRLKTGVLNECYLPHMRDTRRVQIYFGGSSSGKSVFLATRTVLDCLQGRNLLVVRKVARTLRGSCWNEVLKAVTRMGLAAYFRISKNDMALTSVANGAQILFAGLDDVEKIKSITPQNGPLTDIWMEEATECDYADYKQLDKRLRGFTRHKKRLTMSFNPVYKTHWIYTTFFGHWADGQKQLQTEDMTILKTTYQDNRFLTEDDRAALENETDPYYRDVYTLGNWGVLGDVIFRNWEMRDLQQEAKARPSRLVGLDFGFSSDPCGVVNVSYDRARKTVYVFDELYERGLTNTALAERLKAFAPGQYITCDSAEPKSIAELRNYGVRALPAKKGPDSVIHGIQWLKGQKIVIDTKCVNLKNELTLYQWRKDKDGNSLAVPEDRNNHLIDALRYALENESGQRIATTADRSMIGL